MIPPGQQRGARRRLVPLAAGARRCIDVKEHSHASSVTADALVRAWDQVTDGPAPDVWTPASLAWILDPDDLPLADHPRDPGLLDAG